MTERQDAPSAPQPTKTLILHIEVPGVWVDDLDEVADEYYGGDRYEYLVNSDGMGLDERVHVTLITHGDESGPLIHSYDATVVGMDVRDGR